MSQPQPMPGAMPSSPALPRSPELMRADDTALLIIDMQERMLAVQRHASRISWNCRRLLEGAQALGVRAAATEQYPDKLGTTVPELIDRLSAPAVAKIAFSCGERGELVAQWRNDGIDRLLLCGIETHVCVQQTAFDLLAAGFRVYIAADAVGARYDFDHEIALRRMESSGAVITTTEAALFELCERAGTPVFKQISALAKGLPPA